MVAQFLLYKLTNVSKEGAMKAIFDFLISALPWIAIGMFVACSIVMTKAQKEGKEIGRFFKGICWSPAVCFLFVALMEMYSGKISSGTTWLILGVVNTVINFVNTQDKSENGKTGDFIENEK